MTRQELYENFISRADSVGWDYALDMLQGDIEEASYEGELDEISVIRLETWVDTYNAGYEYLDIDSNNVDDDTCGEFRRTGVAMIRDYLYRLSCAEN